MSKVAKIANATTLKGFGDNGGIRHIWTTKGVYAWELSGNWGADASGFPDELYGPNLTNGEVHEADGILYRWKGDTQGATYEHAPLPGEVSVANTIASRVRTATECRRCEARVSAPHETRNETWNRVAQTPDTCCRAIEYAAERPGAPVCRLRSGPGHRYAIGKAGSDWLEGPGWKEGASPGAGCSCTA